MRVTSQDFRHGEATSITLDGTKEEIDAVVAMLGGVVRLRCIGGMLTAENVFHPTPSPLEDPYIPPKWAVKVPLVGECTVADITNAEQARIKPPTVNVQPPIEEEGWQSPHFCIQHLCGYGYTVEAYRVHAQNLMNCGFECLRSRRGNDGKFWELWYLPGTWCAKGPLKEAIDSQPKPGADEPYTDQWKTTTEFVVGWLCHNVSFGTLDVAVQRAAMVVD